MSGEILRAEQVDQEVDSQTVCVEYAGQVYNQQISKGDPLVWTTQYGSTKWIIESISMVREGDSEVGSAYIRCLEDGLLNAPDSQGPLPVRKDEQRIIPSEAAGMMMLQQEARETDALLGTSG